MVNTTQTTAASSHKVEAYPKLASPRLKHDHSYIEAVGMDKNQPPAMVSQDPSPHILLREENFSSPVQHISSLRKSQNL